MENQDVMVQLRNFLDQEGRLKQLPKKKEKRLLALAYLAQKFHLGRIYKEKQVNELLCHWHCFEDPCLLRRELFDARLLDRERDGSAYWRAKGND